MATCLKLQSISGQMAVVLDEATPVDTCAYLLLNGSEYAHVSHGYITNQQDAQEIAFALVGLLAVGWGIRAIRNALNSADGSEEAH